MTNNLRSVLSFRIARELIAQGFPVVDFATSRRYANKVVIKFENSEEFDAAFKDLQRQMSTDQ